MTTLLSFDQQSESLRARHDQLVAEQPKLRARERASRLGVSEAELVAAQCGATQTRQLSGKPGSMIAELGDLGEVMALSRNDWCVHERHGRYEGVEAGGHVGIVLGPDIDLRLFLGCWRHTYAVLENERHSLQFFDDAGVAVHKVYLTEASNVAAYEALVARYLSAEPVWPETRAVTPESRDDTVADPQGLRTAWLGLQDTHDFFPMLRKFNASRLGALRAAGPDLAQQVPASTAETVLTRAAEAGLPIMVFVNNRGIVQIHTGPVQKLLRTGPWFNVLDPRFNLHLNTEGIASSWIVNKPTADGWVTSLEVYSSTGDLIVQFFGARKPGKPELAAWRELLAGLCAEPLAA